MSWSCARRAGTRPTARWRPPSRPNPPPRSFCPSRRSRPPAPRPSTAWLPSWACLRAGRPRPPSSSPATAGSWRRSSAATTTSTRRSWSTRSRQPAGYGPPIGARDTVVVVDTLAAASPNLVAGANKPGFHLLNVNVPRDYTPDVIADLASVREGDGCPDCGAPVILRNGIEVGNIFKLGTKYTKALGAEYLGEDGERHPIVMGSYGIGLGRNVACIVEAHHDEKGIAWPAEVAPYRAHLVAIGGNKDPRVVETAERLHEIAAAAGPDHEILYDDRDESPGVKFTDAELLGMPWIITVSPRSLAAGGAEVTFRATGERSVRSFRDVEAFLAGRSASPA